VSLFHLIHLLQCYHGSETNQQILNNEKLIFRAFLRLKRRSISARGNAGQRTGLTGLCKDVKTNYSTIKKEGIINEKDNYCFVNLSFRGC